MTPARRPATAEEVAIALDLRFVRFLPGTPDKRFAQQMTQAASWHATTGAAFEITDGQGAYLRRLAHRYRRQLSAATAALGRADA